MKETPQYMYAAVEILNKCGAALNNKEHRNACKMLDMFDNMTRGKRIPVEVLFNRLSFAAELSSRLGRISKSMSEIENNLVLFNDHLDLKFKLLIKLGRMEACVARNNISVKYLSEALGVAEASEDNSMIAEAYSAIAQMFSPKYEGLAFYFLRHAELYYEKAKDCRNLSIIRMHRSLLSWAVSRNYTNLIHIDRLQKEAEELISSISGENFNPHELTYLKYVRGVVLRDEHLLEELLNENANVDMLPDKCRYEEMIIGICLEKGMFEKADSFFTDYVNDARNLHGNEKGFDAQIAFLQGLIDRKERSLYIPYRIGKRKEEPTTLFDILNHYSLCDEIWALDKSIMRCMFPTYAQEGQFEAVKMPNGHIVLYPCAIAFNVFYRGQAEYFEDARPTLYRKGMSEAKRFIERIRYEEMKRCVDSSPLTDM